MTVKWQKLKINVQSVDVNTNPTVISTFAGGGGSTTGYTAMASRIGNSVPPNLTKAIGENIKKNILDKIK